MAQRKFSKHIRTADRSLGKRKTILSNMMAIAGTALFLLNRQGRSYLVAIFGQFRTCPVRIVNKKFRSSFFRHLHVVRSKDAGVLPDRLITQ